MIQHFLKILWNQKKRNSLLMIEILLAFVALFSLTAISIHYYKRYNEPLGMDPKNLWSIQIYQDWNLPSEAKLNDSMKFEKFEAIKKLLKSNQYIQSVSFSTFSDFLYAGSSGSSCMDYKGKSYCYDVSESEPDFAQTTGINIVEGRWLIPEDKDSKYKMCVINRKLKMELFGEKPAAGKTITIGKAPYLTTIKIAGVMDHLKRKGEFTEEPSFMLNAIPEKEKFFPFGGILIRIKSGSPLNFESEIMQNLMHFDNSFIYQLEKIETMRHKYLLGELAPILIAGAVVVFLIINVMLGLFGTLWLNISRRKPEIGLRRAVGSTANSVQLQILGETYLLATSSMLIGFLFTAQVFIFNIYNTPVSTLVEANITAFILILAMCTLSAMAPARLASRLEPAQALHEE